MALLARAIGEQVAQAPWCRGPLTDYTVLECNCDLVETLMLAVFPPASFATDISGVVAPFQRRSFYSTPRFEEVMLNKDRIIKQPLNIDLAAMERQMGLMAYHLVLHRVYGAELPSLGTIMFTVPDYKIGPVPALRRRFQLRLCDGEGGGRAARAQRPSRLRPAAQPPPPRGVAASCCRPSTSSWKASTFCSWWT